MKGYSLVELLVVLAIIVIISAFAVPSLRRYQVSKNLEIDAQAIVGALRNAQNLAITGESIEPGSNKFWGAHFENPASGQDFYEIFRGPDYPNKEEVAGHYILKPLIEFNITVGTPINIIFNRLSGEPTASSAREVKIKLAGSSCPDPERCKTITVSSNGAITY